MGFPLDPQKVELLAEGFNSNQVLVSTGNQGIRNATLGISIHVLRSTMCPSSVPEEIKAKEGTHSKTYFIKSCSIFRQPQNTD